MEFEWDADKSRRNERLGRPSFLEATAAFADTGRKDLPDLRRDYGEERFNTFGRIEGRLVVVTWTWRGSTIRIIAARRANAREERRHGD
ncbi:MAG: BrnT family toxin [Pseudomonadota bacterium]